MQTPLLLDAGKAPGRRVPRVLLRSISLIRSSTSGIVCNSAGGFGFLGLRKLKPPSRHTSEFSTRRSALAVAMVVLKRMFPQ